jgi:Sporulation lipoprotein YhcN/YlaJ (Spore_YhcN_YlaJ).
MKRRWVALAAGVVLSAMLSGCMEKQGDLGNRNIRPNAVRRDANGNLIMNKRFADDQLNEMNRQYGRRLNSNNIVGQHRNYRLEMDRGLAERINRIQGIDTSYVMLTDRNAYVAVTLENGAAAQSQNQGASGNRIKSGLDMRIGNRLNFGAGYGADNRTGYMGGATKEAAQDAGLTAELKRKIAREIRRTAPHIQTAYISSNPEFVRRMKQFMEDINAGRPIQGRLPQFNAMVERLFPANTGIAVNPKAGSKPVFQ